MHGNAATPTAPNAAGEQLSPCRADRRSDTMPARGDRALRDGIAVSAASSSTPGSRTGAARPPRARANRGWWDPDADDYQAEHGDVPRRRRLRLGPGGSARGGRRAARRPVAGRRGCWRSAAAPRQCARWLADAGRRAGRAGPLRRHAAARRRAARPRPGSGAAGAGRRRARCPSPTAPSTWPARRTARCRSSPTRRGDARGAPGAAARRALGVLGDPPDALGVPRRPGPGRAGRDAVLLRPHARTSSTTTPGRPDLRRAPPHARRPGPRDRRRPASRWSTSSSRSGRRAHDREWGGGARCAGELIPGTAIFVCRRP